MQSISDTQGSHVGSPPDAGDTLRAGQRIIERESATKKQRHHRWIAGLYGTQAIANDEVRKMLTAMIAGPQVRSQEAE